MYDKQIFFIKPLLKICPKGEKNQFEKKNVQYETQLTSQTFFLILLLGYKQAIVKELHDDVLTKLGHLAFLILQFCYWQDAILTGSL